RARAELHERVDHRTAQDRRLEHRRRGPLGVMRIDLWFVRLECRESAVSRNRHQNFPVRCSTTGPRETTGKYVRPTTMLTKPKSSGGNSGGRGGRGRGDG